MILKIFLFWRLGLFLVTYIGSITFPLVANSGLGAVGEGKNFNYWASWAQWDGGHYFNIAKHGYQILSDFAFLPLYPFLVKLFGIFTLKNYLFSGLIISNISLLLFLIFFFKLIKEKYGKNIAYSSIISFLVFPTTFFTVAFYSESVFLLLTVLVFWFLTKKRFIFASIFVMFAVFTRFIGLFLVISILYAYFSAVKFNLKKVDRRFLYIFIPLLGFAIYNLWLFFHFHDPFLFLTSQKYWGRSVIDPASTIFSYIWAHLTGEGRPINDYFDLASTVLFLTILALGSKKIPSSWWIFSVLVILVPASTGTLTSMPRYLLPSLGTFVILGNFLEKKYNLRIIIWGLSLFVQSFLAVLFINGYWVA